MVVSNWQLILIAVFYACEQGFIPFGIFNKAFNSPLCIGWVIGIILGNPLLGATTGALIQMVYMGVVSVGNTVSSNKVVAATIGVSFVMLQGLEPEAGLVLAVPVGVALATLQTWVAALNLIFANLADNALYAKKEKNATFWFIFSCVYKIFLYGAVMFIILKFGVGNITGFFDNMPAWLANGISCAGGALPAVGLALGLKPLTNKASIWYCIAAFILAGQLGLSVTTMCVLAVCLSAIIIFRKIELGEVDFSGMDDAVAHANHIVTEKDAIKATFNLALFDSYIYNTVKYCGDTMMFILRPLFRKLYPNDQDRQVEELKKYDVYFTTQVALNGVITVPCMLMEEERARGNQEITPETISGYVAGTMGPVAAVGDPLIQAVVNTIFISIGVGMVNAGSAWGAGFAAAGMVVANVVICYLTAILGYRFGSRIIDKLFTSGVGTLVSDIGALVGSVAFGALAATYVSVSCGELTFASVTIQTALFDKILTGLLPLALLLTCYGLLKKKRMNPTLLIVIVFFGAFILGALGILS